MATVITNPTYPVIDKPFTYLESSFVQSVEYFSTEQASAQELTEEEQIIEKIKQSSLPPIFIEIAKAESQLKENAYNPEWHYNSKGEKVCQGSYGLFQVACVHYKENPEALHDIDLNIEMAEKIYKSQGFKAWGVCRKKIVCQI